MPLAPFSVLIHMVWLPDLYHRSATVPISTALGLPMLLATDLAQALDGD
jgi:hypothetical protein